MITERPAHERTPYLDDFGLLENPFRTTPSARYTYLTLSTKEALAHARDLIESRRLLGAITSEVGLGKTTLSRIVAEEAAADGNSVAYLYRLPARQTESKIYSAIAAELELPAASGRSAEKTLNAIAEHAVELYRKGRTLLVIIDDAHKLKAPGLAAVLALINLQAEDTPLVQVLMFGQLPEMLDVLKNERAIHTRLGSHTRLNPLIRSDVKAMLDHRLSVAGRTKPLFTSSAIGELATRSKGIPRTICNMAHRAALFAWDADLQQVEAEHVRRAAEDLLHEGVVDDE